MCTLWDAISSDTVVPEAFDVSNIVVVVLGEVALPQVAHALMVGAINAA